MDLHCVEGALNKDKNIVTVYLAAVGYAHTVTYLPSEEEPLIAPVLNLAWSLFKLISSLLTTHDRMYTTEKNKRNAVILDSISKGSVQISKVPSYVDMLNYITNLDRHQSFLW